MGRQAEVVLSVAGFERSDGGRGLEDFFLVDAVPLRVEKGAFAMSAERLGPISGVARASSGEEGERLLCPGFRSAEVLDKKCGLKS